MGRSHCKSHSALFLETKAWEETDDDTVYLTGLGADQMKWMIPVEVIWECWRVWESKGVLIVFGIGKEWIRISEDHPRKRTARIFGPGRVRVAEKGNPYREWK